MQEKKCSHHWTMVNVQTGFIITENCFKCDKISTYFSFEERPPLEEYREGEHFWNVMESAQTIRFDLECSRCKTLVTFQELSGLMMCTGCDENCKVDQLRKELEKENIWVYVAFGFLPIKEVKPLGQKKVSVLEQYFNQNRKFSKSAIRIVSYDMIDNVRNCYAEVIRDTGMLNLKVNE
jgi:hypothetical protein